MKHTILFIALVAASISGCAWNDYDQRAGGHRVMHGNHQAQHWARKYGAPHDRPFPIGQVSDSFWETQQTNAEADDFVFHDHEFRGDTAELAPGAKRHLEMVAMRLEHAPFPIVIEQSAHNAKPQLDAARRQTIVMHLNRMGVTNADERVVVANAFAEGFTGIEGERAFYNGVLNGGFSGGAGRRFGGTGGVYR